MAFSRTWLISAAALAALGACTTMEASGPGAMAQATSGAYAGKSTLDAAIAAAGGEAALSKVQEL